MTEEKLPAVIDAQVVERPTPKRELMEQLPSLVGEIGTIVLSSDEKEILFGPVNEEEVEIRADGLVYLPAAYYRERLRNALGMEQALIPDGKPILANNFVYWGHFLIIRGRVAAYSMGEQQYFPNNPKMSWGDACEAAKSNALMRCCKGIGMSLELWLPRFVEKWKEKYAEQVLEGTPPKYYWRKKKGGEEKG